jgi:hypothetical protein
MIASLAIVATLAALALAACGLARYILPAAAMCAGGYLFALLILSL